MTLGELLEQCGIDVTECPCIPEELDYELEAMDDDGQKHNVTKVSMSHKNKVILLS